MTTIPSLDSVTDIMDSDLLLVTQSDGTSYKLSGSEVNKRHKAVSASSTTITGAAPLKANNIIHIQFTADLTASDGATALAISYNGTPYTVKKAKDGALTDYLAFEVSTGVYKYLQAYTTLDLLYDGTYLIVVGNPIVLSGAGYTIFANGTLNKSDVGLNNVDNTADADKSVKNSTWATKIGTDQSHPGVGSATDPVYIDSDGEVQQCTAIVDPAVRTYGIYHSGAATIASNVASFSLTAPAGLVASAGTTIKVTFVQELEDASAINSVSLSFGGATGTIKAARGGSLVNLASHQFTGGHYNSNKPHKVWDEYTTLELMWTGTEWLVMGNPVVCSYTSSDRSYLVLTDGFFKEWGHLSQTPARTFQTDITVFITHKTYYTILVTPNSNGLVAYYWCNELNSSGKINVNFTGNQSGDKTSAVNWCFMGL